MLGVCRGCEGPVSDRAAKCPRCGFDTPYRPVSASTHKSKGEEHEPDTIAATYLDRETGQSKGVPGWLSGLLSLLVVVAAGVGGRYTVQAFMDEGLPAAEIALTSDEEIVSRFEQEILQNPNGHYFVRMRDQSPTDYQEFLDGMVPVIRSGSNQAQLREAAFGYSQTYMANYVRRHRLIMRHAEPQAISNWVLAESRALDALASVSPAACSEVVEFGSVTPSTGMSAYPTVMQELESVTNAVFDLIESGRRSPQEYAPLSDDELLRLGEAALTNGADNEALAAIGTSEFSNHSAVAKCSVGTALYRAIAQEPDLTLRARLGAAMLVDG